MIKELKYDFTKDDIENYAVDSLNINPYKRKRIIYSIGCTLLCFIIIFAINILFFGFSSICLLVSLIIAIIEALFSFFFDYPKKMKKSAKEINKGKNSNNSTVIISNDSNILKFADNDRMSEWKWTAIKKIYNLKCSILLFVSDYFAIIIPKRIFENEKDLNETWELIQECYNKNREELK